MIRRTFLKALAASPLGFLVPKTRSGTRKLVGKELEEAEADLADIKQTYVYYRYSTGVIPPYRKKTCGGARVGFLETMEVWNHSTQKWDKAFN